MADGTYDGNWTFGNGSSDRFFVKFPQILKASAPACHHDHIHGLDTHRGGIAKGSNCSGDLVSGPLALDSHGINHDADARLAAMKDVEKILNGGASGGRHHTDAVGELGKRAFALRAKEPLCVEATFEFFKFCLQGSDSTLLHTAHDHLIASTGLVNGNLTEELHLHAIRKFHPAKLGGLARKKNAGELRGLVFQCEVNVAR